MAVVVDDKDVVVIGAGLSGLVAARRLEARGARVAVVEARDRVGGKLKTIDIEGVRVDLGGRWVAPADRRLVDLAAELELAMIPSGHAGRIIHHFGGRRRTSSESRPRLPTPISRLEASFVVRRLERMRKRVPREHPWFASNARHLDSITLQDFKRSVWSPGARRFVDFLTRVTVFAEPREVSLLYFLSRLQAGGGVNALVDSALGVNRMTVSGGAGHLCETLRSRIEGEVTLGDPAVSVEQDATGVNVNSEKRTLRARYAIVALSPMLAGRLRYSPPLPAQRDALCQRMPLGAGTRALALFERPWWREQGLSGLALADSGIVRCVFDATPLDARRGVLAALVTAQASRDLGPLTPEARRRAVLAAIARLFGLRDIEPLAYTDHSWDTDPWSRGANAGYMGPGTMTAVGSALREPVGRIHWAGTATALERPGGMEGAVESGERVAQEVLARIGEHRRQLAARA
jgi:monoamine oxidase